ncbi:MAG: hypothetical protein WC007_11900 [Pelobacteraceae bacterium]
MERLGKLIAEIRNWDIAVDNVELEFIIRRRLEAAMAELLANREESGQLSELILLVEAIASLPIEVNLWQAQNIYWEMLQSTTKAATSWSEEVIKLGQLLYFNAGAVMAVKGDI